MEATTGASGGICMRFSAMGIGFGFNNPKFSDRVLKIHVTADSLESKAGKCTQSEEESKHGEGSPSGLAPPCGVKTVYISSLVLASQSPFFYKMFSNGMKESEQQSVTLSVKASEELALLDLLQFLYDNVLKADTPTELLKVLILADRYQVASCVTHCAQTLSSLPMTFELALSCQNLPSSILEGDNPHLRSLIDTSKCFLSENFSSHYEEALELTLESIENIFSWDTLEVDSEDEVYDFVLNWAKTHYEDLSERRQVFGSRLCQLVRFPYMSCEKLKIALNCEELEQGDATKMVVEALLSKIENHLTHADATSICQGRVYRLRPVEVIVPDSPYQECIVYSKLKKEECHTVKKTSVGIRTQKFHVGNESFYLEFSLQPKDESLERKFGIALYRCMSKSTTDALKLETEVAVRLKTTGKFTAEWTGPCALKMRGGWWVEICESWDSFMGEDGQHFHDGILYVRVTVAIKQRSF